MFTGLVREVGTVVSVEGDGERRALTVAVPATAASAAIGDSVAVAGVCLTVEAVESEELRFHAVAETVRRTTLGRLAAGDRVNVEPALRAGDPLGGHLVQGHVDGLGTVRTVEPEGEGVRLVVATAPELARYCVEKGSIAVDGVSLTIAGLDGDAFAVALVPHTLAATTLGTLVPGEPVNLEVDILAKYAERLLAPLVGR